MNRPNNVEFVNRRPMTSRANDDLSETDLNVETYIRIFTKSSLWFCNGPKRHF